MKRIILYPEQNDLSILKIIVRDKDYQNLKKMQYSGGFKRFGLSLYDDIKNGTYTKSDAEILAKWLNNVFVKPN